ncbi:MAG: HlyC/CorC family transporter [Candidatus Omnitrophica bacterium]|nr:HlyC/CorC family transporter [Candidatus Omnitrophota bacterium]
MILQHFAEFIFFCALILFFLFAALSETSLISVSRIKLRQKSLDGSRAAKQTLKILEYPEKLFGTMLVVNNITGALAASLATVIAIDLFGNGEQAIAVATAVVTILFIVIEVASKTIAVKRPEKISFMLVWPVRLTIWIFTPLVWGLTIITKMIVRMFGISMKQSNSLVSEEEIKALIKIGEQEGSLEPEEGQLLQKVFRFGDMTVREAMTPISDMVALNVKAGYEDIMRAVVDSGYSRLPVYSGNVGNIVGIAQVKDLLSFWENKELIVLQDVMDPPNFISSSKKLSVQLKEFQRGKSHMSIVIDAQGKVVGLMTLEDIIEEIVGEIEDEYDQRFTEIEQISPGVYATSGYCRVQKVNETLGVNLSAKEFVTLNGLIIHTMGHVPKVGESCLLGSIECVAQKIELHRIIRVEIRKKV